MSSGKPTTRQPQQMPFYAYLEKELPAMQKMNPNTEKVRLMSELVHKWDRMNARQQEEYEVMAIDQRNQTKTAIEQALSNITSEIIEMKKRELPNRDLKIEKQEQVEEQPKDLQGLAQENKRMKPQQSQFKKTRFQQSLKKPTKQTPEFIRRGEISIPSQFITYMTNKNSSGLKVDQRGRQSMRNILPIKIEEDFKSSHKRRPKSVIVPKKKIRRSKRLSSK